MLLALLALLPAAGGGLRLPGYGLLSCSSASGSLPSAWNAGACEAGAKRGLWNVAPDGRKAGGDALLCLPFGGLSCQARLQGWSSPHIFLEPPAGAGGPAPRALVLFLHGTGAGPLDYLTLLAAAARAGHYVLGLSYLSQPVQVSQTNSWCTEAAASALLCNEELHELVLFGRAPPELRGQSHGLWDVPPADSVEQLLVKALQSVAWGTAFLDGDQVRWERLIVSGHSQGGGHAAYLSYKKGTRAVLFSAPQDCTACASEWLEAMAPQRVARRALYHAHEECGQLPLLPSSYCEPKLLAQNLERMGLGASPAQWHGGPPPEDLTHVASTALPMCLAGRAFHSSVAVASCAPYLDNITELWTAMFTGLGP